MGSWSSRLGLSSIRRRRRGRSFRFTREGKVFVAVALGVGVAAINTGNNLLYLVLGLLLSLLLVSGTLSDLALFRLTLERRAPKRMVAKQPTLFEVALKNRKGRIPTYAVEVEDLAEDETSAERRCFFLKVAPGATQVASYARTAERRGRLSMTRFIARTRYPFGLIEKGQQFGAEDELIVFPAPIAVAAPSLGGRHTGEDGRTTRAGMGDEVLGLREYRRGDEARAIHWRRSAALDRVVVREHARVTTGSLLLRIDSHRAGDGWEDAFETSIGRAAYLVGWALREGRCVQIEVRGARSSIGASPADADALLRFLALVEVTDEELPFGDVDEGVTLVRVDTLGGAEEVKA